MTVLNVTHALGRVQDDSRPVPEVGPVPVPVPVPARVWARRRSPCRGGGPRRARGDGLPEWARTGSGARHSTALHNGP